jgi:hypothetical protein
LVASAALLIRLELERNKERMEENERITNIEGMEGKMLPLFWYSSFYSKLG